MFTMRINSLDLGFKGIGLSFRRITPDYGAMILIFAGQVFTKLAIEEVHYRRQLRKDHSNPELGR